MRFNDEVFSICRNETINENNAENNCKAITLRKSENEENYKTVSVQKVI